jgi:hypothetical protein
MKVQIFELRYDWKKTVVINLSRINWRLNEMVISVF